MNLDLSDEQLEKVVTAAIMESISKENKDELIKGAVESLMEKSRTSYGRYTTPIKDAFSAAATKVAVEAAKKELESNEEFQLKIKELLAEAMEKVFNENRGQVVDAISNAVIKGFETSRGY